MNIDREAKKAEAVERMKALGIFPETVRQFEREDYVSVSGPPVGAFFWADGEDLQRIREFEEQHNALVYLIIRSYTKPTGTPKPNVMSIPAVTSGKSSPTKIVTTFV